MTDYAEKILRSPDLPQVVKRLNQILEDESRRRHEFREWVTPGIKAEFINGAVVLHGGSQFRHWRVSNLLSRLLSFFVRLKKLGVVGTCCLYRHRHGIIRIAGQAGDGYRCIGVWHGVPLYGQLDEHP